MAEEQEGPPIIIGGFHGERLVSGLPVDDSALLPEAVERVDAMDVRYRKTVNRQKVIIERLQMEKRVLEDERDNLLLMLEKYGEEYGPLG